MRKLPCSCALRRFAEGAAGSILEDGVEVEWDCVEAEESTGLIWSSPPILFYVDKCMVSNSSHENI